MMKKGIFNFSKTTGLVVLASALGLSSCKKDRSSNPVSIPTTTAGIYVLCEGPFSKVNNSSITYYDVATKTVDKNYFKTKNGIDLGTNANDLKQYGSKAYCVITGYDKNSRDSYVEVINIATGKSLKRIPFFSAAANYAARYVAFHNGKAYVSSYDGYISKIDTASLTIESRVLVGGALEALAVVNNKLYVTNSNHSGFLNPDNASVSVVDLNTFTKIKSIPVTFNPRRIVATNNGDLFSISAGDYVDIKPAVDKLSSVTDTKVQTFDYNLSLLAINGTKGITFGYLGTNNNFLKDFNISTGALGLDFIKDGTTVLSPYGITFNTLNNDILIADANGYSIVAGKAFYFGADGKKKYEFETAIFPQSAVFYYK